MGEDGQSAGGMDHFNGLGGGNFALRDPGGLPLFEKAFECLIQRAAKLRLDQSPLAQQGVRREEGDGGSRRGTGAVGGDGGR